MKLWILYSKVVLKPNKNNATLWMLDEAIALGFDAEIIYVEDLTISTHNGLELFHKEIKVKQPDIAFTRSYHLEIIDHLESMGVKTFNNSTSLGLSLDKYKTHKELVKHNIQTPKTLLGHHRFEFLVKELSIPFIVKDRKGARGEQVFLVDDEQKYSEALDACPEPIFQEFVKSSFGKDIRLHVIKDKVVACVLRQGINFKSNYSQGGSVKYYEADDILKQLAIDSTQALGLDFSGIDVLFTDQGYTICEVNGVPGFRTVGLTSDINMPQLMLTYIKETLQ